MLWKILRLNLDKHLLIIDIHVNGDKCQIVLLVIKCFRRTVIGEKTMRLWHYICGDSYKRIFTKNIYIVGFFFTKNTIRIAAATSSSSTQVNMYSMSPFEKFSKDPIPWNPPNPCLRKPCELCCSVAEKWVDLISCTTVFFCRFFEIRRLRSGQLKLERFSEKPIVRRPLSDLQNPRKLCFFFKREVTQD